MLFRTLFCAVTALCTIPGYTSELPSKITFQSPCLDECRENLSYNQFYLGFCGEYLRDNYFLPLRRDDLPPYFYDWEKHALDVVGMLKGEVTDLDPTFPELPHLASQFTVRDIPVKIESREHAYLFNTRVIESKEGPTLRLVLFSLYGNSQSKDETTIGWDPTSTDELGMAALEVIKALQQHTSVDSMICSSLGSLCLDTLKHVTHDFLPPTIIWNRALTSTWKAGMSMFSTPSNYLLYWATSYLNLYSDPENALADFCAWADQKRVVVIQAKEDTYFSGDSALDPLFFTRLQSAGVELYEGSFLIPMIEVKSHHACRLDMIHNNRNSGSLTENFLPMKNQEPLSECLARHIFMGDEESHTCFIVGGNKDTLDSLVYLHALPLLSSYFKLMKKIEPSTPTDLQ